MGQRMGFGGVHGLAHGFLEECMGQRMGFGGVHGLASTWVFGFWRSA